MVTFSLCMIVKNEEKTLAKCLDSIKDVMDEIIIIDTGSEDQTKRIALSYTDKVYDFEWTGNFSDARNFSFSKATCDYIYSADADEVIEDDNLEKLRLLKENLDSQIEIVQMKYCNRSTNGSVYNLEKEYRPKLFKRMREFVWIDPVHETVRTEPVVFDSDIEIAHYQQESHAGRDLAVFQRITQDNQPLSDRLLDFYVKELYKAGTEADLTASISYFEMLMTSATLSMDTIKKVCAVLAKAARLTKQDALFLKYTTKAIACEEGCSEIAYELGQYFEEKKDYSEAALWYYNAAYELEMLIDVHSAGNLALFGLSRCYASLNQENLAKEYENLAKNWKIPEENE